MTLEQTRRRRQAVNTIHDIVSAMRAIAAGRIQGAQRALTGAGHYQEVILRALSNLATDPAMLPAPVNGRQTLLLVLTSEQPLCGAFNQNVLALAGRRWHELRADGGVHLLMVGERGRRQLLTRGITPDRVEPAATSLQGVRDLVKRLAPKVDRHYASLGLGPVHVIYSRYQSISQQVPAEEELLPPDLSALARLPPSAGRPSFHYLPLRELLAGFLGQYAFISLYRMAAESYASEQASRLIAMDGATHNTERIGKALLDLERRERQGEITRQVLELISARFAAD
ncbi:MAG TPA: FoF1 ATP synthase subunit gamma [Gemmataceae bacterium]|jgi:F-type H+-transporting ATPase subunit gamma